MTFYERFRKGKQKSQISKIYWSETACLALFAKPEETVKEKQRL